MWSLSTTTLVSVMLPGLDTTPLKARTPPALAGDGGQLWVTEICGVVWSAHVAVAEFVTPIALHESEPETVTVVLTEQESAGAVNVAEYAAEAPGANEGRARTVGSRGTSQSTTMTLTSVLFPVLRTTPV